jgi:hypothetical protein
LTPLDVGEAHGEEGHRCHNEDKVPHALGKRTRYARQKIMRKWAPFHFASARMIALRTDVKSALRNVVANFRRYAKKNSSGAAKMLHKAHRGPAFGARDVLSEAVVVC